MCIRDRFKKMVSPGDEIEISVKLDEVVSSAYFMTAVIRTEGKIAARLSVTCSMAKK